MLESNLLDAVVKFSRCPIEVVLEPLASIAPLGLENLAGLMTELDPRGSSNDVLCAWVSPECPIKADNHA